LKSIFLSLHEEDQVDLIMHSLPRLEYLNGLKVERDLILGLSGPDDEDDDQSGSRVYSKKDIIDMSRTIVKEEPSMEDREDDDEEEEGQ
jgi:hypothetical protein